MIKLTNCTITIPIDRIRGTESIAVAVNCTFSTGQTVPGVALCSNPEDLQATVQLAIENAKDNLTLLPEIESKSKGEANEKLGLVFRDMLSNKVQPEIRKYNSVEAQKMLGKADENQQKKVTGLCEALGIDIIKVQDEWTNVEVLLLINTFEKMTEPLTGDV